MTHLTRRNVLRTAAATAAATVLPMRAHAQSEPVKFGILTPLLEGLKALSEGKEIIYEGASGICDFNEIGDISQCRFRFSQVKKGKLGFLKIV